MTKEKLANLLSSLFFFFRFGTGGFSLAAPFDKMNDFNKPALEAVSDSMYSFIIDNHSR